MKLRYFSQWEVYKYIYQLGVYKFMRSEIGELVPIKLIERITRNYGKVGKIMINTKEIKKSND